MTRHQFEAEKFPPEIQEIADRMNIEPDWIPPYKLPELPFADTVSADEFLGRIRPGLVRIMGENMYGPLPPHCDELVFRPRSEGVAFDGLAVRREIDIVCRHRGQEQVLHLLLYIPANRSGKVPVFFGLNFKGNHACTDDPGVTFHPFVRYPDSWTVRFNDNRAGEDARGIAKNGWCFEKVLRAGFASATIMFHDICPDRQNAFDRSIMRLFYDRSEWESPERSFGVGHFPRRRLPRSTGGDRPDEDHRPRPFPAGKNRFMGGRQRYAHRFDGQQRFRHLRRQAGQPLLR